MSNGTLIKALRDWPAKYSTSPVLKNLLSDAADTIASMDAEIIQLKALLGPTRPASTSQKTVETAE